MSLEITGKGWAAPGHIKAFSDLPSTQPRKLSLILHGPELGAQCLCEKSIWLWASKMGDGNRGTNGCDLRVVSQEACVDRSSLLRSGVVPGYCIWHDEMVVVFVTSLDYLPNSIYGKGTLDILCLRTSFTGAFKMRRIPCLVLRYRQYPHGPTASPPRCGCSSPLPPNSAPTWMCPKRSTVIQAIFLALPSLLPKEGNQINSQTKKKDLVSPQGHLL